MKHSDHVRDNLIQRAKLLNSLEWQKVREITKPNDCLVEYGTGSNIKQRSKYKMTYISKYVTIYRKTRHNAAPFEKKFVCTYRVVGVQILSSPSFIVVA